MEAGDSMAKKDKPKKQKKPIKIWAIATSIILVIAIALNVVLFKVPLVTGSVSSKVRERS